MTESEKDKVQKAIWKLESIRASTQGMLHQSEGLLGSSARNHLQRIVADSGEALDCLRGVLP